MATGFVLASLIAGLPYLNTLAAAQSSCDPIQTTCPAQPGLTSTLYTDFTQVSSLPSDWTLAAYETVNFGPNGAEFIFNQPPDSPYIWTTDYFLFGHVEVVLQAANGTGIISSVVMMSDDLDEVDWEFSGNNFGGSTGVVQTNYFGKGITGDYDRGTQPSVDSPQTEFHTYTYDWSAESLTWSIDGTVVRTLLAADEDDSYHQYPQTPVQLHLGLWDAGAPNTSASTVNWAGGYTDLSQAPFTMYVKSVKIVPSNACATYAYGDMSGTWQSIKCGNSSSSVSGGMSVTSSSSSSSTAAAKTAQSATTTTSTKSTILSHVTSSPASTATGGPSRAQQNQTVTVNTCTTAVTTTTASTLTRPAESSAPPTAAAAPTTASNGCDESETGSSCPQGTSGGVASASATASAGASGESSSSASSPNGTGDTTQSSSNTGAAQATYTPGRNGGSRLKITAAAVEAVVGMAVVLVL